MQASNVYITIGLDREGNVVEVSAGGRTLEPRQSGQGLMREGSKAPGCEKVLKVLVHELLTCRKEDGPDRPPDDPPPPGSDPCCYRDPQTGRVWCWC